MSDLPISSKYRSRPDDPVDEAERTQLSKQLNDAFTRGDFDQETYSQNLDRVFAAQRLGDLAPVVELIGKPDSYRTPAIVEQAPGGRPGELSEARKPGVPATMALMGGLVGLVLLIVVLLVLL